jgi:hypothetical protein
MRARHWHRSNGNFRKRRPWDSRWDTWQFPTFYVAEQNVSPHELIEIGTHLRRRLAAIRLTGMRGDERDQDGMFSYISLEQRVHQDHPLRAVRKLTDAVLRTRASPAMTGCSFTVARRTT